MGALDGLRVVDVTTHLSGPYCSMLLADMGADVVKVERPDGGDEARRMPQVVNGESAPFMLFNRNKRGVVLDLKTPPGQDACRRLGADGDVFLENMKPGTAARLGLGYEELSRVSGGGDPDVGVEVEAVELGLARAAGGDVTEVWLVAEAPEAGAGAGAEGDAALDGGAGEAGQDGRGFGERVRRGGVLGGLQLAAGEQLPDTGADGGEDLCHVLIARWRCGVKGERPGRTGWRSSRSRSA